MGIVTPPIRKTIKALMVTKYIDQCGIKMPKVPSIPDFTLPPMPSLELLEEELSKIANANANINDSIYTSEYLKAYQDFQNLCKEALNKYNAKLEEFDRQRQDTKNQLGEMVIDITEAISKELEIDEEIDKAYNEYSADIQKARKTTNIDNITKFKRIDAKNKEKANEAAEKETEAKKNKAKTEALELLKELVLKQYADWLKNESEKAIRFKEEITTAYKDTVALFESVKEEAKAYFQDGGPGDAFVEAECNKIDTIFDNFKESFTELGTDLSSLVAKIPNPDVIVAGAATGVPNPAQKIMIFMENMKKVITDTKKIIGYIKEILAIAAALRFAIKDMIPAFKQLCDAFDKLQNDSEKQFKKGVKMIRKRQKWFAEHEYQEEDGETRLAGYMYADVEVDWVNHDITIKGYKCYCKKDYAKKYKDDKGLTKKSLWKGAYKKNQGPFIDSSGNRYYYLSVDEISVAKEYDENDIIEYGENYDIDLGTSYDEDTDTTTLNLSDGRTIVIDYLAASGDVIRLDDGSIVKVR